MQTRARSGVVDRPDRLEPLGPERAAAWISRAFHPFAVPLPVLVYVLHETGSPWPAALGWTLLCVGIVIVPSLALLVHERRKRADGDWFVTVREERRSLYALGSASLFVLLALLVAAGAPRLLVAALVGAASANAIAMILNRRIKVSVHAGACAGSAVLLGSVAPFGGLALSLATLAVGWARIRLGHHTLVEVLLGAAITPVCVGAAIAAIG